MEAFAGVLGVVLGAVAGTIVTYITTRSRMRLELEYVHDRGIRERRRPNYQELFHRLKAVPRQWRPDAVPTRADLRAIREELHDWYFGPQAGGMFLTEAARRPYFQLQNALESCAAPIGRLEGTTYPLTETECAQLYEFASNLRHQLSADVGTAEPPRIVWARPAPPPPAPSRPV